MFDLRSSRAVKDRIEACGGIALKSRVGHSFIKADMRRQNVVLAGELSAHYYWGDLFYTDNAVRALIEMANLLSMRSVALSSLIKPLQKHVGTGEINFKTTESLAIIEALKRRFAASPLDFTDGLTVEFSDWWFNVRTSQTEPLVRLCVGAVDETTLSKHRQELEILITEAMKAPVAR
jgi:phosphomannomutase